MKSKEEEASSTEEEDWDADEKEEVIEEKKEVKVKSSPKVKNLKGTFIIVLVFRLNALIILEKYSKLNQKKYQMGRLEKVARTRIRNRMRRRT